MATHGRHTRFKANALATQALDGRMRQLRGSFTWNRYPHLGPQDLDTMEIVSWISNGETSLILDVALGWYKPSIHIYISFQEVMGVATIYHYRSFNEINHPAIKGYLHDHYGNLNWASSAAWRRSWTARFQKLGPWLNGRTCFFMVKSWMDHKLHEIMAE